MVISKPLGYAYGTWCYCTWLAERLVVVSGRVALLYVDACRQAFRQVCRVGADELLYYIN